MNLGASVAVIRPRSLGEVLDLGFRFSTTFFRPYARLAAAVLGPAAVVTIGLRYFAGLPWIWVWIIAALLSIVLEGPFTVLTSRLLFGERLGVRGTMRFYRSRLGAHVGALLLTGFYSALGWATFFGGPFVAVFYLFVDEAVLLENAGAGAAHSRSRRLSAERSGSSFMLVLTLLSARVGAVFLFESLGDAIINDVLQLGRPFGSLLHDGGSPIALLGLFAATPFIAVVRFLAYIDIRTRSDAWDVQVRFMDLASRDAAVAR